MKAEQRRLEESARLERNKEKQALELAMKDTRTLAGFDMETDLKLSLLHQQLKVIVKSLKERINNFDTLGTEGSEGR